MARKKTEGLDRVVSTVFLLVFSILCIVFSACLLFVNKINEIVLCYVFCAGIVGWGIALIARYFGKGSYKKMHDYNFTFGLFIVIVGCTGLVRAADIAASFNAVVGIICLLIGVMLLQSSIQLRAMNSTLWTTDLILSLGIVFFSIIILFDVDLIIKNFPHFPYLVLFVASIANTLNFPLLGIKIHIREKREEKENRVQVTQQTISTSPGNVLEAEVKEVKTSPFKRLFNKNEEVVDVDEPIVLDKSDLPENDYE